jgi:hypothetical protein
MLHDAVLSRFAVGVFENMLENVKTLRDDANARLMIVDANLAAAAATADFRATK